LRQLKAEYPGAIELVHRAFVLRPDEGGGRRFTAYHLQHRAAATELSGLPFDLPEVGAPYPRSSLPALEATEWVKRHHPEQFEAYDLALYEAFFRETRDISNLQLLVDLAERLGVDGAALRHALQSGECREAVWADHREALERGVTSIPTVRIGDAVLRGAVPYEEYEKALRSALANGGPAARRSDGR
jgi:predicted DsbA family dithiol-disulfide isomerase